MANFRYKKSPENRGSYNCFLKKRNYLLDPFDPPLEDLEPFDPPLEDLDAFDPPLEDLDPPFDPPLEEPLDPPFELFEVAMFF